MSVTGPNGGAGQVSPWWLGAQADSRTAAGTAAAMASGRTGSAFAPTVSRADEAFRQSLLEGLSTGAGNELARLTQIEYSSAFKPDFLAVRTGAGVTAQYAGGHETVKMVGFGANITFFATGAAPNAGKGVAITFGPEATAADRKAATEMAQSYLAGHLSDAQDARGRWNQPTFDMFV